MAPEHTTPPDGDDPILRLAESVADLADEVARQTTELGTAVLSFDSALSSHRRANWIALAAVVIAGMVAVAIGAIQVEEVRSSQRDNARERMQEEAATCERGNDIRRAVVRGVKVAVEQAAVSIAGDDPTEQEEAVALAAEVSADVARDPALMPRACPTG